ncbi:hypothetical protein INT44_005540 [Umbelopsis vinacea]|uniref:3-oxoacyl-[acyl-carrier-protein] reductase n=1 Tax=Umbelopsis vinacea TaxID=44442 RepID=A0A8H7PE02_9FUNG|nr:hypothetical protein INT44_005540 [Umbelopsis vinacea]
MNPIEPRPTLAGRNAVVTGGASGIGEACARKLFSLGCTVVISDVNVERGQAVVRELMGSTEEGSSIQAIFIETDMSQGEQTKQFAQTVLKTLGTVHILVNCAGIQTVSPIESFPEERFRFMNELMLVAPFLLTQAFLPSMYEAKWGRIVNIGSIHSLVASPAKVAYVMFKHALVGLTKSTAVEGGPHGVTANCICPSYVRTPLVEKQIADQAVHRGISEDEVIDKVMLPSNCVIRRLLEPNEVAELCAFLCSDAAQCITGSEQKIDCGWTSQ